MVQISPSHLIMSTTPSCIKYILSPIVPSWIIWSPGWNTSKRNLVTTSETKFGSVFAKNGTDGTRDRQLYIQSSHLSVI